MILGFCSCLALIVCSLINSYEADAIPSWSTRHFLENSHNNPQFLRLSFSVTRGFSPTVRTDGEKPQAVRESPHSFSTSRAPFSKQGSTQNVSQRDIIEVPAVREATMFQEVPRE